MPKFHLKNLIKQALVCATVLLVPVFYLLPASVSAITPVTNSGGGGGSTSTSTGTSNLGGCGGAASSNPNSSGCYSQCANSSGSGCVECNQNGTCGDPAVSQACNKAGGCDIIGQYINPAINLLSALLGLIAVISIILGGIQFSTSEGDPQKAAAAKARISKTLLAIFAYAFLYAFLQFIIPGGFLNP